MAAALAVIVGRMMAMSQDFKFYMVMVRHSSGRQSSVVAQPQIRTLSQVLLFLFHALLHLLCVKAKVSIIV